MDLVAKVEKFVYDGFKANTGRSKSSINNDIIHSINTLYWVEQLPCPATLALEISAIAHDCDRAFTDMSDTKFYEENEKRKAKGKPEISYDDYKRKHAAKSAEIICNYLKKEKADEFVIRRAREIVKNHEFGGFLEVNVLRAADSISFFHTSFVPYLRRHGKEKASFKLQWTYDRIKDDTTLFGKSALEIANPLYKAALTILKNAK